MDGSLIKKISIPPGLNKMSTRYEAGGSWFDSNNMRFSGGYAEPIGGWRDSGTKTEYQGAASSMLGVARGVFSWSDYSSNRLGAVGTNLKFYAVSGITAVDITPIRLSVTSGVTFAASTGSSQITVTHSTNGVSDYDFVTFGSAASLGDDITAAILNKEHQVVSINNVNSYVIDVGVLATSGDTGNGGASVTASYQVPTGQINQVLSDGGWGDGSYDSPSVSWDYSDLGQLITDEMRRVFMDNYNEDLIVCNRGGPLYYYDVSQNIENNVPKAATDDTRAQVLSSFDGSSETPTVVENFLVSERDGHVIAFGCNDLGSSTQNNLLVRWSDQNNPFDWDPSSSNTSGGYMLRSGSRIIGSMAGKSEILIWTNSSMYSMRFVGPPSIFSFTTISSNVNIVSTESPVNVSGMVLFMGKDGFYSYSGSIRPIPCPVSDYVFENINWDQAEKVFSGSNSAFNEAYWFYPSSTSFECDRYVCFDYSENNWYVGDFDMSPSASDQNVSVNSRTSWEDANLRVFPTSTYISSIDLTVVPPSVESNIALHELKPSESAVMGIKECYVETGEIDISDGDKFTLVSRFIPDIIVPQYGSQVPVVSMSITARDFPGGAVTGSSSKDITMTDTANGLFTPTGNETAERIRGRSLSYKFSSEDETFKWRLGGTRIDGRPDGRR